MPLRFQCDCGKRLVAPEARAGTRARCPICGAVLEVPRDDGDDESIELLPLQPAVSRRSADSTPREARKRDDAPAAYAGGESTFRKATGRGEWGAVKKRGKRRRPESPRYRDDLKATFLFPANIDSLIMFVIVWLILCFQQIILPYGWIYGLIGSWIIYGWFCGYRFSIIAGAASGDDRLPRFELEEFFLSMLRWWGTWIVALLPAVLCAVVVLGLSAPAWFDGVFDEQSEQWYLKGPIIPVFSLLLAGLGIWPMLALCVTMGGFSTLLRVDVMVWTILRTLPVYLLTVGVVFAALFVFDTLDAVKSRLGLPALVPVIGVGLYLQVVAMRMIGLYYHHFKHRFAWSWG